MLLSCETVRISSPAFYKDPPLHESQFKSPADAEINLVIPAHPRDPGGGEPTVMSGDGVQVMVS